MSDEVERADDKLSPFALRWGTRVIPLPVGDLVVGRGADCDVLLDSARVSRRHAELSVTRDRVIVKDLGSINGVRVDSERISGQVEIKIGARIKLADEVLVLIDLTKQQRPVTNRSARTAQTMELAAPVTSDSGQHAMRRRSAFSLLTGVADKALAMGRGEEAERVLSKALSQTLDDARAGTRVDTDTAEAAARYALRLADVTSRARWIDYAIELYAELEKVLPMDVIDGMHDVLRKVSGVKRAQLERYLELLRQKNLSPAERFALKRLEGAARQSR